MGSGHTLAEQWSACLAAVPDPKETATNLCKFLQSPLIDHFVLAFSSFKSFVQIMDKCAPAIVAIYNDANSDITKYIDSNMYGLLDMLTPGGKRTLPNR